VGLYSAILHAPLWAEAEHIRSVVANDYHLDGVAAFPYVVPNSVGGSVVRALGLRGAHSVLCMGPGSGLGGLAASAAAVQGGRATAIVSLAADEPGSGPLAAVVGESHGAWEGAAAVVVESAEHARLRGAAALASVEGFVSGFCGDARERAHAALAVVRESLARAHADPGEVCAVCADDSDMCRAALGLVDPRLTSTISDGSQRVPLVVSGLVAQVCLELLRRRFEEGDILKYILCLHVSDSGYITAVVLRIGPKM